MKVVCFDRFERIPKSFLKEAVEVYQIIFGEEHHTSGSVWGEGAYCLKEGRSKKISLEKYKELQNNSNLKCECGSEYEIYHTPEAIIGSIKDNFNGEGVIRGRVCFLTDNNDEVKGFSWGNIRTLNKVIEKLNKSYADPIEASEAEKIRKQVKNENTLFFEEIGILRQKRGKPENTLALTAPILELSEEKKVKTLIFRTLKNSRVYSFSQKLGFKVVSEKEDRVIIVHKNIRLIFRLLKAFGPGIMKATLKALKPV